MTEYAVFGLLINGLSIFGAGMLFGILGLLFGITRGITKNDEVWALTFSTFAWITSFILVETSFATTLFVFGCVGYMMTFQPMLAKLESVNVYVVAMISLTVHLILAFGLIFHAAYTETETNQNVIENMLDPALNKLNTELANREVPIGVCDPADTNCDNTASTGGFESNIFDPLASVLNIAKFFVNALKIFGYIVLAPFVIGTQIASLAANNVVSMLLGVLAFYWNMTNLYNLYKFVFNKRGV